MKHYIKPIFFLLFLMFLTTYSISQFMIPYYGKNKVLYEKFTWEKYATEHFNIYYYAKDINVLKNIADMAESAYQTISQNLKHELSAPVPLIYYNTSTDFEQTNLFQIPEGVLGVAEPILYRIAIRGDFALDETQDLIEHELTHIFEYDLIWGSPGGVLTAFSMPPNWVFEGFSEYNTGTRSSWSTLILKDAVLNDRIPELQDSGGLFSRFPLPRDPAYDFGHAIYEFIESKYGKNGIREFWHSMRNSPLIGKRDPIKRTFDQKPKEFNHEFKKYLRARYKDFLLRENPEDYSIALGPEFPINPYYFSFSHALSPSGDIVAVMTYNVKDYDIDIVLISTKDGSVIRNITKGYTNRYENIKIEIDISKGRDLDWSYDGDKIAFFGRSGQKHSLFLISPITGKTIKKIKVPMDQPSSLCFYPDNNQIAFTAFQDGRLDIFKVDLTTEEFINLTENDFYEKAPVISPDGKSMVYSLRLEGNDKLFISPVDNLKQKKQLTFGDTNTITPKFSHDSKTIYFSGDGRDAFNLYSLSLETGELKRYTDVRTGNFYPAPLSEESNELIFASFNKGSFQIFKGDLEGEVEKTITFAEEQPEEVFKKFEPILKVDINEEKIESYKGLGKFYMQSKPPLEAIISTDGSVYGGTAIAFSDLLGDRTFTLTAYQTQSFRSYFFYFLNQKRRLAYMASAYQYTIFYYPPYAYYDSSFYRALSYRDAQATRKITGASLSAYYPFNKYYRVQASLGFSQYEEDFFNSFIRAGSANTYNYFWNGNQLYASLALTGETTRFKAYGPASGSTFRVALTQALPVSDRFLSNTTVETDFRKYLYLGGDALFAFRLNAFGSFGKNPYISYFGGNNQVRSENYFGIVANEGWFANLEFRFPVLNTASSLIGQIGPVRGVFFFDIARSKLKGFDAKFYRYDPDINAIIESEAIGSYGFGFQFFFLGFPMHLEFVKRVEVPAFSHPLDIFSYGQKFRTRFWIGFDF
ncbi:hypothetical protein ACFLRM_02120 [Acidobacteriota bacterium]